MGYLAPGSVETREVAEMFSSGGAVVEPRLLGGDTARVVDDLAVDLDTRGPFSGCRWVHTLEPAFGPRSFVSTILLGGCGTKVLPHVVRSVQVSVIDHQPVACDQEPDQAMNLPAFAADHKAEISGFVLNAARMAIHPAPMGADLPIQMAGSRFVTEKCPQFLNRHRRRAQAPARSLLRHGFLPSSRKRSDGRAPAGAQGFPAVAVARHPEIYTRRRSCGNTPLMGD